MMVDDLALLRWLDEQAKKRDPSTPGQLVIASVYAGLADRIRRGDFDHKVSPEPADFTMAFDEEE